MLRLFRGKSIFLFLGVLCIGVACGLIIAARFNIEPHINAEVVRQQVTAPITGDIDLKNAFVKVADKVGPAVVSISSERVDKVPGMTRRFYFGPGAKDFFGDDFFDKFFEDFFGEMPEREYRQIGLGSGVIIDAEGYILTNEHVISGAEKITVTLPDGRSFKAKVKGIDPRSDLAIIKIDATALPFAVLGNSDLVQTGEWVVAIGNPFGFAVNNPKPTVTVGVVSALHRSLPRLPGYRGSSERAYLDLIQTDAAINPGNSGGPLCDLNGRIIGINVAIVSTTGGYQGVGFAIPSNVANNVVGDLIKGKKIVYGWFGVAAQDVTDDLAKFFGLPQKEGVLVASVTKDGPAQKAGIKGGDIILSIDNEEIKTVRDILSIVGSKKPGTKVDVMIFRDRKRMTIPVIVGERPSGAVTVEEKAKPEVKEEVRWRGIKVIDITPELASRYNIQDTEGVLVSEIDPASPAGEAGLNSGDIIREINKTPVRNKAEYNKVVTALKGDVLLRTDKGYLIVKEEVEVKGE
ncbi:MAG: Do family serine endopeptidase [Candidatus Omnitrophica bacterium]|nr:Do family serine endopeptidase [Candidatus Omnitrophota bacterium]